MNSIFQVVAEEGIYKRLLKEGMLVQSVFCFCYLQGGKGKHSLNYQ